MARNDPFVPALRFRWLTPFYDSVVRSTTREREFKQALLDTAALEAGWRVLDLACGTGTLALAAKRGHPETSILGLDGDSEILALARGKAQSARLPVAFCQGLSHELPFPDASLDCVLSSLFLHHLQPRQKQATLAAVRRALRPGGTLLVADWGAAPSPLSRLLFLPIRVLDGFANTADHVAGRLPQYLMAAGFDDVRVLRDFRTIFGRLSLLSGRAGAGAEAPPHGSGRN